METILNLVWLGVTLAIIWLWRFRWTVFPRNSRRDVRQEIVALVCVLALLFPVISLSDDLHPEIVAMDAAGGKRNASQMLVGVSHSHFTAIKVGHLAVGVISRPNTVLILSTAESLLAAPLLDPIAFASNSLGRAPPSLL